LSCETRISYGIERQLPASLSEALDELERSQLMACVLGEELVIKYLEVKREEKGYTIAQERGTTTDAMPQIF
jgi:glutamine synthetase